MKTSALFNPRVIHKEAPGSPTGPGLLVETSKGEHGRTYNRVGLINTKVPVYFEKGPPRLFNREDLKLIGYVD